MANNEMYIIGGQQKKAFSAPNEEHERFGQGIVATFKQNSDKGSALIKYVSPAEFCAPSTDRSILFKSGSISKNHLYLCTQTEVLVYSLEPYDLEKRISLPHFNDVHHAVETTQQTLLVVSTGVDMVFEITPDDGQIVNQWDTLKRPLWTNRSKDIDYRRILTTKPHDSHPNFAFQYKDEYWVTRFEQKDAISLTSDRRIDIGIERPHDGHIVGTDVYFTTVDGHVVIADMETTEIKEIIDLHACKNAGHSTGWARGLKVVDEDHVIVAFSTLRVTKFRENVRWIKRRFGKSEIKNPEPTHIAMYNLKTQTLCWRSHLLDPQIDVVFSVL